MKQDSTLKTVLGPLWKLYAEENVHEILIDSYDELYYVHKKMEITNSNKIFKSKKDLEMLVSRLLKWSGQEIGRNSYTISLSNCSRVHIALPPLAIKGPALNFSMIRNQNFTLDDLLKWDCLTEESKKIIEQKINGNRSILVAGKTGSGKTTLLNILINSIAQPKRVVTLEHSPDLVINRPKVCRLQSVQPGGKDMVDLVYMAEKMRADYLVLSDCHGAEVMPFLESIRNASSGMALITAENVLDAIKRLEVKALLSSEGQSMEDVRYAIAQALNIIVYQELCPDGKRRVTHIAEIKYDKGELKIENLHKR